MKPFFAEWKAHGERQWEEADTMDELRVLVFGRPYSPAKHEVRFYTREVTA